MVNLSLNLCGLELRNPILPAAGPTTRDGAALLDVANNGAGGLVAKTVTKEPSEPPRPNLAKIKNGLLSAQFSSEIPIKRWLNQEYQKAKSSGLPLIANIGYNAEEIAEIAPQVVEAGADALELTVRPISDDPSSVMKATEVTKDVVDVPVFVKLSLQVPDITEFAKAAEEAGADGIVAIDAVGPCLAIDVNTARPLLGSKNGYGWLSGPPIKPLALRCVMDIARKVDVPVIGAGGVSGERDVAEFIMAGAAAVELCTAAITRGSKIYGLTADGLSKFMRSRGYESLEDFRGLALRHLPEEPAPTKIKHPEVLTSKCTGCALCLKDCPYDAVSIIGETARIDPKKCTGCGLCVSVCKPRALRI